MSSASPYVLIAIPNLGRAAQVRQVVTDTLALEALQVRDGEETLQEIARRGAPAILLVDLSLPRIDGFAAIRRIRRQISEADTRIIAVAAHDSLRAAARELAIPLAIASVLPLDADAPTLGAALEAVYGRPTRDARPEAPPPPVHHPGVHDIVERAATEARRRCHMPVGVSYLRCGEQEQFTFHFAVRDAGPIPALGDGADFRFLRQVAEAADPLVIPSVESHPVFAQFLLKGAVPVRGFAAVPVTTTRENIRAALCVLDTKTSALSASEVDALAAFGREVGEEIDQTLSAPRDTRSAAPASPRAVDEEVKALQHLAAT